MVQYMDFNSKRLLHTPEGVRDIYGKEYQTKLKIQELFHEKFSLFGYEDIQTPSFEFFDVFGKEVGTTPSRELYKFFDKEGNTLVLRPDFTPSIARCAAKYLHGFQDWLLSLVHYLWMKHFHFVFAIWEIILSISVIYRVN